MPPKVTKEEVPEEEVPTITEIKENETAAVEQVGNADVVFDEPVQEVVDDGGAGKPEEIFTVVEQMPEYAGGYEAMMKFISQEHQIPCKRTPYGYRRPGVRKLRG